MNAADLLALDPLAADCLAARNNIRSAIAAVHDTVTAWTPAPCPPRPDRPLTKQQAAWMNVERGDILWDRAALAALNESRPT